jgi:hypothetical protein
VLRGFDDDIRDSVHDSMERRGMHVALGANSPDQRGDTLPPRPARAM